MAERNMVASLFGLTPQMYGEQQRVGALEEGIALAQLNPAARGAAMTYAGAKGLGTAIGGAMGVQDPALNRMTQRNQLLQELDATNPESMLQVAKKASSIGDNEFAMALVDKARKTQSEMALAQQRLAQATRERQQAVPADIQVANEISSLTDAQDQLRNMPASPERDRAMNMLTTRLTELQRLTNKEKPEAKTNYGAEADRASKATFNKNFSELTQAEAKVIDDLLEERGVKKAKESGTKVLLPGQPVAPKDWMDFSQKVLSGDPVMQRTSTILSDAPSAIDIIRQSTSNDFASASLPSSIARLTGEGKNMSNADVNRFARTGGLDDRLAQDAVKFFTGGTTQIKKEQAEKFSIALYRGALLERKKKLQDSAKEFGYTESPNYKIALENIDNQLGQFTLKTKGTPKESTPEKTGNPLIDKYLFRSAEKQ